MWSTRRDRHRSPAAQFRRTLSNYTISRPYPTSCIAHLSPNVRIKVTQIQHQVFVGTAETLIHHTFMSKTLF